MSVKTTKEQRAAIRRVCTQWDKDYDDMIFAIQPTTGMDGAVVLPMPYESGHILWMAIETDGYVHT